MTIKLYELVGKDETRPFSPHCWKARMALAHKQLEYETIPVRFTEIANIENGGQSIVPVIRHGDNVIADSYDIAFHLAEIYPDKGRKLFRGHDAAGLTRFVESWSQSQIHLWIAKWALMDIYNMLDEADQAHFRAKREKMFGMPIEEVVANREERIPQLLETLKPIRVTLAKQAFIGGKEPLFADYVVFGALQFLRIVSGLHMIPDDDPVKTWFNGLLDMHDGLGRTVSEANS